jgi:hypothetical protein
MYASPMNLLAIGTSYFFIFNICNSLSSFLAFDLRFSTTSDAVSPLFVFGLPCLSYIDEPWSPASATTDSDDASLASSISLLSPNFDLDTFPGEPVEDQDEDSPASRCLQNCYTTP